MSGCRCNDGERKAGEHSVSVAVYGSAVNAQGDDQKRQIKGNRGGNAKLEHVLKV